MTSGRIWIDPTGVQIGTLHEHGRLWVFDQLPYISRTSDNGASILQATASPDGGVEDLARDWWKALQLGPPAPEAQTLFGQLEATLGRVPQPVVLIVRDAHLLRNTAFNGLRLIAEWRGVQVAVALEGDVSAIDMATRGHPSFYQRAFFCIRTQRLLAQ